MGFVYIAGGKFTLKSDGDGISASGYLLIDDGTFNIYTGEGSESVTMETDSASFGRWSEFSQQNTETTDDTASQKGIKSDGILTVNGGSFVIVSNGDCIDSNGALTFNGGDLDLTCNGNGNTALDCDGEYTNNGGDVTTNDGSENNPGQMGGAGGMGGMNPPGRMG